MGAINAILIHAKGKEVTVEQIRKALGDLQATYRERGYPTVTVLLPQQQITNATVIVQVIEAPYHRNNGRKQSLLRLRTA